MPAYAGGPCDAQVPIEVKTTVVDGVKGNFISPASMNRITFVLTECVPSYRALIESQARLLDLRAQIVVTSSKTITAAELLADEERERGARWKEAYKDEHQALTAEREAHSGVLASPTFWLSVGVVVGVAATLGVAFAYAKVQGAQ